MPSDQCPLCSSTATLNRHVFTTYCECTVCGEYAYEEIPNLIPGRTDGINDLFKRKVACVMCERNILNQSNRPMYQKERVRPFIVSDENIPENNDEFHYVSFIELLDQYPKSGLDLFDRTLINLSRILHCRSYTPTDPVYAEHPMISAIFFALGIDKKDSAERLYNIAFEMENLGYIRCTIESKDIKRGFATLLQPPGFTIRAEGWNRLRELQTQTSGSNPQAFVGMWFHKSRNEIFSLGIKPAIEEAHKPESNVIAKRVDYDEHNDKICDHIISEIRRSRYAVIDVTGNNAGAYYEGGFAQGLNIPVIWAVEKTFLNDKENGGLHFDIRQYNAVVYENASDLKERLETRIKATIPLNQVRSGKTSSN